MPLITARRGIIPLPRERQSSLRSMIGYSSRTVVQPYAQYTLHISMPRYLRTFAMEAYIPDTATHTLVVSITRDVVNTVQRFFGALSTIPGVPQVTVSSSGVTVHMSYYMITGTEALTRDDIQGLLSQLTTICSCPVSLMLVKLSQPYLDARVLATYVSNELAAEQKFASVVKRIFATAHIVKDSATASSLGLPSWVIGLKVELAGRLMSEPSRPRLTVQTAQIGSLTNTPFTSTQLSSYTAINMKGTYTVKVWLCQRFSTI